VRHELHTEIDIDAPPSVVWGVLTDLSSYPSWNPFITSSEGEAVVGERLTNRMEPPGGKAMTFRPTVTVVENERVFEWLGPLGVPGIFDGRHRFEIEATATGSHFSQSEVFTGLLVRFLRKSLNTQTVRGFEASNRAIKERAEARAATDV
jgi:hypothetical protein